jgi:hypothetical protein
VLPVLSTYCHEKYFILNTFLFLPQVLLMFKTQSGNFSHPVLPGSAARGLGRGVLCTLICLLGLICQIQASHCTREHKSHKIMFSDSLFSFRRAINYVLTTTCHNDGFLAITYKHFLYMSVLVFCAVMPCGLVGTNQCFSKMLVSTYNFTWQYNSEDQPSTRS